MLRCGKVFILGYTLLEITHDLKTLQNYYPA